MKAFGIVCCAAVLTWSIAGCILAPPPPPDTHDADVKAIADNEDQWNKDYAAKDLEKVASHYADDAVLMVPGMAAVQGKQAIHDGLQEMLKDPALVLQFKSSRVDVAKSGDVGYTQGSYEMAVTDPMTHKVIHDHGSFVTTYRKQADGSWKAEADIATSEVPSMPIPEKKK